MRAERHRFLADRIQRSVELCHPDEWEMKIEAAMLAGTHWVNFVLHVGGHSSLEQDVVHTGMLVRNTFRKYALAETRILECLEEIEELRPLHVRGDAPGGEAAGDRALLLLAEIAQRGNSVEVPREAQKEHHE